MTDAINNNNRVKAPNVGSDPRGKSVSSGAAKADKASQASAVVELSSDQLMGQIDRVPEVDSQRIESIKNALANGEYKPDPEVIARKFAEIEKLLP